LALFTPPGQESRIETFSNIGFFTDDMDKTYQTLTAHGVEFEKPPKKESWGTSAVFKDLDGNTFALSSK
jgi:predicted enzyme related to lactoylglutathione lyase